VPFCLPAVACRIAKRKQALPAKDRRQLGYAVPAGKKDAGRTVLLTEDVAEALQEVSGSAPRPAPCTAAEVDSAEVDSAQDALVLAPAGDQAAVFHSREHLC
jgi:hypothetical protein